MASTPVGQEPVAPVAKANSPLISESPSDKDKDYGSKSPVDPSSGLQSESDSGEDDADIAKNPFLDPDVAAHWRKVYDDATYECRHVLDPHLTWSREEERRLVRKLDWRVCLWACVMFFGLQVDRNNLTQAVSDNLLDDLGLTTDGAYFVPRMIVKQSLRWERNRLQQWQHRLLHIFSLRRVTLPAHLQEARPRSVDSDADHSMVHRGSQPVLDERQDQLPCNESSYWAIGGTSSTCTGYFPATSADSRRYYQGGFIPDMILWLSYFYTSRELPIRLRYVFPLSLPTDETPKPGNAI